MMLKRYQTWMEANPLLDWLLSVGLGLAVFLTLFFVIPGPRHPRAVMLPVVGVLGSSTYGLLRRFSEEKRQTRPIPLLQERGVAMIAVLASLCSIGAFVACIFGKQWDWPMDQIEGLLITYGVLAVLSLELGYAVRYMVLGRWAMGLSLGWFALMIVAVIVRLLVTAVGRT